ncbi:MAG: riboflavin biosynthesis protein RibF [Clostridiaceae bacterium]|nr:riboflavin biosynthesis protein RibF [Clostridiaceae bacterium]
MSGEKRAIALGFFDGVHRAHREVLSRARTFAAQQHMTAAAVTFDHHPAAVLAGETDKLVQTLQDRVVALRRDGGMEEVIVLPFDAALRTMSWEDFAIHVLAEKLHAGFVAVGYDYRFGYRAEGDPEKLSRILQPYGIPVSVVERIDDGEGEACGTRTLRKLIAEGDVLRADELMGRPFSFTGEVIHGKGLGHTLGFPTMNVSLPQELVQPKPGVYVASVTIDEMVYPAVTNVWPEGLTESFVFFYSEDIYGKRIRVALLDYVRPMRRFESLEELTAQVISDKNTASVWFKQRL